MSKNRMTREEIEDQKDVELHMEVMTDPNTEWVEWNSVKNEIQSTSEQEGLEGSRETAEAATGKYKEGH